MDTKRLKQATIAASILGGLFAGEYSDEIRRSRRPPKPHRTKNKPHRNRTKAGQRRRKLNNIAKRSRAVNR